MRKFIVLLVFVMMLFAPQAFGLSMADDWQLADGIIVLLDPDGEGGNINGEVAESGNSPMASPGNAYYWKFIGLLAAKNIPGAFNDNGYDKAWRIPEIYRIGGTNTPLGRNQWGQSPATMYEASVESYLAGTTHSHLINDEWMWKSTVGPNQVNGIFQVDPFRFELNDHVSVDYYGYSEAVGYNTFFGSVTEVVKSVFPIPEPSTMLLFGTGLACLVRFRRNRT